MGESISQQEFLPVSIRRPTTSGTAVICYSNQSVQSIYAVLFALADESGKGLGSTEHQYVCIWAVSVEHS